MINNDIQFLCKKTNLDVGKLLTLIEDDFNNVAEAICDGDITDEISFPLFTKLTIFRGAKKVNFSLAEKSYVADTVALYYPKLHNRSHYMLDNLPVGEHTAQYYLVLTGLFPEFLIHKKNKNGSPSLNFYVNIAQSGFINCNKNELAKHVNIWVDLLYDIRNYYWN